MSEPNSLFARIYISKASLERFQHAPPTRPQLDENWHAWWNSRQMYGKTNLQTIPGYAEPTNAAILQSWLADARSLPSSDYDAEKECWKLGMLLFSENYYEMLPALAFLKSIAPFKTDNREDFALIYNYFWDGDEVSAYLCFENGAAHLAAGVQNRTDVHPDHLQVAEDWLDQKRATL